MSASGTRFCNKPGIAELPALAFVISPASSGVELPVPLLPPSALALHPWAAPCRPQRPWGSSSLPLHKFRGRE